MDQSKELSDIEILTFATHRTGAEDDLTEEY